MRRISNPVSQLKSGSSTHFDVIVVGTGYGGGVAASRLARAGQSVCVLERGKELLPGEYPDDPASVQEELQLNTAKGHIGSKTGMYEFHINEEMNVLVGCGMGGTSLINANVALTLEQNVFEEDYWPQAFRAPGFLDDYYDLARRALTPEAYPASYPRLNKLEALALSAKKLGMADDFYRPPINVTFRTQTNQFGVKQRACVNCGDCCTGCNYTSKNTTLMNYLPDAFNHGADFFTEAQVDYVEKNDDGVWVVHVTDLGADSKLTVSANLVVLGAGTLGSTGILLRSKEKGLALSAALGSRFSGNGDVLGFGYNSLWQQEPDGFWANINGIGVGANDVPTHKYPGPCITGIIDNRGSNVPVKDAFVVEEGVLPGAFAQALAALFWFADTQYGNFLKFGTEEAKDRIEQAQKLGESVQGGTLTANAYRGPVGRLQTYLLMSHDDAAGRIELKDNAVRIEWPGAGRGQVIARDNDFLARASDAIAGQYIPSPVWNEPMGERLISVHPIGGCVMSDDSSTGVVNDRSQVYTGEGQAIHEGLYVCDGSVIPGAVGVNPLLTITAITERAMQLAAAARGWKIDYESKGKRFPAPAAFWNELEAAYRFVRNMLAATWAFVTAPVRKVAQWLLSLLVNRFPNYFSPGLSFTETMEGFVTDSMDHDTEPDFRRISDAFWIDYKEGSARATPISYLLTIATDNVHQMTQAHTASVTGWVASELLPGKTKKMMVSDGKFTLFDPDPHRVETWTMIYDLNLVDQESGESVQFHGEKYLHQKAGSHFWNDVTTLFVTISQDQQVIARGVMTLDLDDAFHQANTVKTPLPSHPFLDALVKQFPAAGTAIQQHFFAKFAAFCGETVFKSYGGLLADLYNYPARELKQVQPRSLRLPAQEVFTIPMPEGAQIRLFRYENDGQPVILAPGLAVTAQSYATPAVDENLAERLWAEGYDVWLFAYRASPDSGNRQTDYTIDDIAQQDWPQAVEHVLGVTGRTGVQVIAHCVGSMSLLMGLLTGKVEGVDSVISSQLTLHPVTNWLNYLKADVDLVDLLVRQFPWLEDKIDIRSGAYEPGPHQQREAEIDTLCWSVPVPEGEACNSPLCRRIFAIFGPPYTHAQLNHETHLELINMFHEIATHPFRQISMITEQEHVVDADGNDSYLNSKENIAHLALPITFMAGGRNQIFMPETSLRTFEWLKSHNDASLYHRKVFPEYAHMDCFVGKNASKDVFPFLVDELRKHKTMTASGDGM